MAASEVDFVLVDSRPLLRSASPLLEEGLAAIQARGMSTDMCFGDLYAELLAGRLACRLIRLDTEVIGFVITEVVPEHNGDKTLCVSYIYGDRPTVDVTEAVVDELSFCAHEQGCSNIRFKTIRTGWERRLARFGFHPTAVELTKAVGG
ncbi:hypothetical protein [Halomonas sp. 707B3]|uniref:hypothetical protein n=1 Tax=Halomonas sp. 707B3 TaxID=1681043 RepID=UPI00209C77AB|nr:hypothetical protein [Halomonas sp. 707B3]MCP1316853.1 hypothetical protein [Halomonas sp. 707B3]